MVDSNYESKILAQNPFKIKENKVIKYLKITGWILLAFILTIGLIVEEILEDL